MAIKTNKSDVIATFVRYHGRQPTSEQDLKTIEYLTTKAPAEVESLLAKNSPVTGGKLWVDYQKSISIRQTPVAIPNPSVIKDYTVTGTSADGKTLMGIPKTTTQQSSNSNVPIEQSNNSNVSTALTTSTPSLTEPVTGLDQASYDKINNYINGLNLTQTEKDFLKGTFLNKDTYTSGRTVPTTAQISQWIADAATNAATDINPYYTRISAEELAKYKQEMADIRAKSETFQANEENTYQQKLADTKQKLRAKGLTFSGTAIKNIGSEAAVENPTGVEGSLQTGRRLDYQAKNQELTSEANKLSIAAEQRLGSTPVSNTLSEVGTLAAPADLSNLRTSLYTPTGQYGTTGSMASTIEQERAANIELAKQSKLNQYRLTL